MRRHDNAKDMTRTQIKGTCTPECTRSDLAPFRGGAFPPPLRGSGHVIQKSGHKQEPELNKHTKNRQR